jgi:hypothetical protein
MSGKEKLSQTESNLSSSPVIGSAVMLDVNALRETLDMLEWCLDGKSKNIELYLDDLPKHVNSILKHYL